MNDREFATASVPDENGQWGTINGQPITDDIISALVADAEADFPGLPWTP